MSQASDMQSELQSYVRTQTSRCVPRQLSQAHKHLGTCFLLISVSVHHPTHWIYFGVTAGCYLATLCIIKLL